MRLGNLDLVEDEVEVRADEMDALAARGGFAPGGRRRWRSIGSVDHRRG